MTFPLESCDSNAGLVLKLSIRSSASSPSDPFQSHSPFSSCSPVSRLRYNNFARLSPKLVPILHQQSILSALLKENKKETNKNENASTSTNTNSIEFMPLKLTFEDTKEHTFTLYASYNGGVCLQDNSIELPDTFFLFTSCEDCQSYHSKETCPSNKNLHHDDSFRDSHSTSSAASTSSISMSTPIINIPPPTLIHVEALPLSSLALAASIHLEPISASDWELIEIHSALLENSIVLEQVSIVYTHQILTLLLQEHDFIRVRVIKISTESKDASHQYPEEKKSKDNRHPNKSSPSVNCVHLVANTQVIILPKPRTRTSTRNVSTRQESFSTKETKRKAKQWRSVLRIQPNQNDYSNRMKAFCFHQHDKQPVNKITIPLCPPPFQAWVHPHTFPSYLQEVSSTSNTQIAFLWKAELNGSEEDDEWETSIRHDVNSSSTSGNENEDENNILMNCLKKCANSSFAIVKLGCSSQVERGHIVLNPSISVQLNVTPLYNVVHLHVISQEQLETVLGTLDAFRFEHPLSINIFPVQIDSRLQNNITCPWRYPENYFDSSQDGDTYSCHENSDKRSSKKIQNICNVERFISVFEQKLTSKYGNMILYDQMIVPFSNECDDVEQATYFQIRILMSPSHVELDHTIPLIPLVQSAHLKCMADKNMLQIVQEKVVITTSPEHIWLNLLPIFTSSSEEIDSDGSTIDSILNTVICLDQGNDVCGYGRNRTFNHAILFGDKGTGKTHVCLTIAAKLRVMYNYATEYIDCMRLQSSSQLRLTDMLASLTNAFGRAIHNQPAFIILDNLDVLLPDTTGDQNTVKDSVHLQQTSTNSVLLNQVKLVSAHLSYLTELLDTLSQINASNGKRSFIVCTSKDESSIFHEILLAKRFAERFHIPPLSALRRKSILRTMLNGHDLPPIDDDTMKVLNFVRRSDGYRPCDLRTLVTRVAGDYELYRLGRQNAVMRKINVTTTILAKDIYEKLINHFLDDYVPVARTVLKLKPSKAIISWSCIGGLFLAKAKLNDTIIRPVMYKLIYDHAPILLPRGVLLFGPSGSGKSCLIPALAEKIGYHLITCRGPEILDKYIGMSEANVRHLFEQAYSAAPSILFFDDLEALAPRRGSENNGVTDRIVNQMLTYLDGVEGRMKENGKVYVIAATCRPDKIDPALIRPGRLESHIYLNFPETADEFMDVVSKISASRTDINDETRSWIDSGHFVEELFENKFPFHRFSPADIKSGFDNARLASVHEYLSSDTSSNHCSSDITVRKEDLMKSFLCLRPSLPKQEIDQLTSIYREFASGSSFSTSLEGSKGQILR